MINSFIEQDFIEVAFKPEYLQKAVFVVTADLTKVFYNVINYIARGNHRATQKVVYLLL